jgi:hypothetical protein
MKKQVVDDVAKEGCESMQLYVYLTGAFSEGSINEIMKITMNSYLKINRH